jgi:hypothetical protein
MVLVPPALQVGHDTDDATRLAADFTHQLGTSMRPRADAEQALTRSGNPSQFGPAAPGIEVEFW